MDNVCRIQVNALHDPIIVVELLSEQLLDDGLIQQIKDDLDAVLHNKTSPLLIISFNRVHYISSMFLRMLLNLRMDIQQKNGQLRLAAVKSELREVFAITRLDSLFDIHSNDEEALNKMKNWYRLTKGDNGLKSPK